MVTYSFVVPIYNDGRLAEEFCKEFRSVFEKYLPHSIPKDEIELIFVNDGSKDDSYQLLKQLCTHFKFVKVIDLSRNFGQHIALSCGYKFASGKYVGMLNVDMQDPPHQIPLLLEAIKTNDYDIVHGLYAKRNVPWIEHITSVSFNFVLNKLTGFEVPLNTSTLRIMNRKFVEAYNSLTEKSRYIPGLELWLGFKRGYVAVEHQPRKQGVSSYNFKKRLMMASDSIISFSDLPLKIAVVLGTLVAVLGLALGFFLIIQKLFFVDLRPGYTSTMSVIIFLGGGQILFIGLASLYVGRILREVQGRPIYIVRDTVNF